MARSARDLALPTVVVLVLALGARALSCTSIFPPDICTTLPMVRINANGQFIDPNFPNSKIYVDVDIVANPSGVNWLNDTGNVYAAQGRLKVRGQTSRSNAKKSYTLDTWTGYEPDVSPGTKNKVSLFGMPESDEWVLYAPWGDKPMLRNALVMNMTRALGRWAPRGQFVEVVLNAANTRGVWQYAGVYVLMEKIGRGSGRVDIAKLTPDDNSEPAVSGGYIVKIDKVHPGEIDFNFTLPSGTRILGVYPDASEITAAQASYISDYMIAFESALNTSTAEMFDAVAAIADVASFVDYFLVEEAFWNSDGFRASTYFYKDRGGLLTAGPVWDMDVTFANMDTPTPEGWQFLKYPDIAYWWHRLLESPQYQTMVLSRWTELRAELFTNETLGALVAGMEGLLFDPSNPGGSPAGRNYARFLVLNTWLWPGLKGAQYLHSTYPPYVVDGFATWWPGRLAWMDENLPLLVSAARSRVRARDSVSK